MPAYYTVQSQFDQFFLLKEDEAKTKCSLIINLLFGVLVDKQKEHVVCTTPGQKCRYFQPYFNLPRDLILQFTY